MYDLKNNSFFYSENLIITIIFYFQLLKLIETLKLRYSKNLDNSNIYIFFKFGWNFEHFIDKYEKNKDEIWIKPFHHQKEFISLGMDIKKNFIFLCPNDRVLNFLKKHNYNAILCNHNCFLNENIFKINNKFNREYNAVINSRSIWIKRVYLADKVDKLLYIKGKNTVKKKCLWDGYKDMKLTLESGIPMKKVVSLLNKSKIGLILSGNTGENIQHGYEGACYSCGEYLLCGLPVVSTFSQGGREYWLNDYNSIICEPDSKIIKQSVDTLIKKIDQGDILREKIRTDFINLSKKLRKNLFDKIQYLFNTYGVEKNAEEYFYSVWKHKVDFNSKQI